MSNELFNSIYTDLLSAEIGIITDSLSLVTTRSQAVNVLKAAYDDIDDKTAWNKPAAIISVLLTYSTLANNNELSNPPPIAMVCKVQQFNFSKLVNDHGFMPVLKYYPAWYLSLEVN